jgi:hypothetical protein
MNVSVRAIESNTDMALGAFGYYRSHKCDAYTVHRDSDIK